MTYKESYMMCDTLEQLEKMIASDIVIAKIINSDRLPIIRAAGAEVANLKFAKEDTQWANAHT